MFDAAGRFEFPGGEPSMATLSVRYGPSVSGARRAELHYKGDRPVVAGTIDGVELPAGSDEIELIYADEFPHRGFCGSAKIDLELSRAVVRFLETADAELLLIRGRPADGGDPVTSAIYADVAVGARRAARLLTSCPQCGMVRLFEAWWQLRSTLVRST